MTYRRVVNRNGLAEGDYAREQAKPYPHVGIDDPLCGFQSVDALERGYRTQVTYLNEYRMGQENARSVLLGDLRRLERDAVDENGITKHIAQVTGIDTDLVALVVKEFMTW